MKLIYLWHIVNILTKRRHILLSSLLASNSTQNVLKGRSVSSVEREIPPVALSADKHSQTNHHRIAFSTTSFPFKDPSPHSEAPNLLGIRIDVCSRSGRFNRPYYFLLKREGADRKRLKIHRHTIPAFIPLKELEEKYLPTPRQRTGGEAGDEGEEALKPWKRRKQNLPRLVRELRRELVAWHLRRDAVQWIREELGFPRETEDNPVTEANVSINRNGESGLDVLPESGKYGIVSLAATSLETRYIRLVWSDGRVGRIKLSNRGQVERAIVFGEDGREKTKEGVLVGGDGRIESLVQRLRAAEEAANST
jgi:central kinetochore subunit Mal2/MCM21